MRVLLLINRVPSGSRNEWGLQVSALCVDSGQVTAIRALYVRPRAQIAPWADAMWVIGELMRGVGGSSEWAKALRGF